MKRTNYKRLSVAALPTDLEVELRELTTNARLHNLNDDYDGKRLEIEAPSISRRLPS